MHCGIPREEGKIVETYHIGFGKRAVDCPICGKMEHAPDVGQSHDELIEKYCETYFGRECQAKDWCKYYIKT